MKPVPPLLLSITILSLLFPLYSTQTTPSWILAPYNANLELGGAQELYYAVSIAGLGDHDLMISLTTTRDKAPKLFVSKTDKQPRGSADADYSSIMPSGSVIFIPNKDLANLQTIYIMATCSLSSCEANFNIEFTREIEMTANGPEFTHKDDIKGLKSAIVRLNVPSDPDANRIIIHVEALSTDKTQFANLNMYVSQGPNIPTLNRAQSIPHSAWYEGRTAVIYKESELFCTGCQYILRLEFHENTELRIETQILDAVEKLGHQSYLDAVQQGKHNSYTHKVSEAGKAKDLVLSLQAQNGTLVVYIDCGLSHEQFKDFRLRYNSGKANEQIVLSPEEHKKCKDLNYTIVVFGNEDTVYSIKAAARESTNLQLKRDAPVVGTLVDREEVDYELFVPLYLTEKVHIKLEASDKADIYVMNCRFYTECPNSLSGEFKHVELGANAIEPTQFVFASDTVEGGKQVTIDVAKNGCYALLFQKKGMLDEDERDAPVCAFKIVVKSKQDEPLDYTLSAETEGHHMLYAGQTEKGVVYGNETQFYLLHVPQDELLLLQFQLTVLSGNAKMFVSRNNPYPNVTEEATADHEGAVVYKKLEHFAGTYYVAIVGVTTSSFLLNPTVVSLNAQPIDYAPMLDEGVEQKGVILIRPDEPVESFYKFTVNLQADWKGKIKISVTTLHGHLIIAMSNDDNVPTIGMGVWVTHDNVLEISSDDPNLIRQNVYHIGLYADIEDPGFQGLKEITYSVSYHIVSSDGKEGGDGTSSNKIHMMLTPDFAQRGVIQKGDIRYYKFLVHPQDTPVTLFKEATSGDVTIYLSTDPTNQYPTAENAKMSTASGHRSDLTIKASDLDPTCLGESQICSVYFTVTTSSATSVEYTLTLQTGSGRDSRANALEEGKERSFMLPAQGKPALFYFYPSPRQDVLIDVFSAHRAIQIYASTESVLYAGNTKTDLKYPSNIEAQYSSIANEDDLNTGTAHLAIVADPSGPALVVTIAVYFTDAPGILPSSMANTFSIVASAMTRQITPGKVTRATVEEDSYLYYILNVPNENCIIFITLTNVGDGDSDLFVSYGEYERPTKEDHKFASSSKQRTELLEINMVDAYPLIDMRGKWVIGVYGKRNSSFALTASYEGDKMVQLQESVPVELYRKKNEFLYFTYYHEKRKTFDIRVDRQSGVLGVYVIALDPGQDVSALKPNGTNFTWRFTDDKQTVLQIKEKDPNFCQDCLYIIGIQIIKSSKFTLLVTEQGGITVLQSALRYSDRLQPGEKKKYMLLLKNFENVTLSASLTAGQLDIYALNNVVVNSTVYVWNMRLDPESTYEVLLLKKQDFIEKQHMKSFWDGTQHVISQENVFYFDFENNGIVTTEYSFSLQPPGTTAVLNDNQFHDFIFKEKEEKSFLFYTPHTEGSSTIDLKYCLKHDETNESLDEQMSEITTGFNSEISFWTEKSTVGVGTEISLMKDDIMVDSIHDFVDEQGKTVPGIKNVCLKQSMEIEDQDEEGKYEILLSNTYNQQLEVSIRIDSTQLNFKNLDRNYHDVDHFEMGEKRSYKVTFSGDGYGYLDLVACSGVVTVQLGDSLEAIQAGHVQEIFLSEFGGRRELFYKNKIEKSATKYFIITTHEIATKFLDLTADIMISTNYFTEDTGLYTSSAEQDGLGPVHDPALDYKFNFDYDDSSVTVNFKPITIPDAKPEHNMVFHIRLCPVGVVKNKDNHCIAFNNPEECFMGLQYASAKDTKTIKHTFEGITPGDYDLHISASMSYGESFVRSFAYKPNSLSLGEPVLSKLWDIVLFIVTVGTISICLVWGFQKLKKSQMEQGRDMRVFRRTRDYGFVGDDDEEDDNKGEEDNLR